ncbi:MAG: hypothetical protein JWP65_433 [Ramlibacter sp.]|uniref:uroporphyrinogen-III synthase n=1 Tax=Ramlibacter sp. TaxID=1917967 RepID=UPI002603069E|nr:uroporphyrinogen-III synthase [Ramlibacter sp.]MDB5750012.1 hypothetical protein [Ramlibacter sp.]
MPVVITRPARDGQRWVEQLRARGIPAQALPLLAIGPAPDAEALCLARDTVADHAGVMFVSANAVQGFFGPGPLAWPANTRAWAPGPGTAEALREQGLPAAAIAASAADAAQFDSENLWKVVAGQLRAGDRLLLVRGADETGRSQGREWLAGMLAAAGVRVDVVSAYSRGVPAWTPGQRQLAAHAAGAGSVWLFSSSQAAGNLRLLAPDTAWERAKAIATHPRIAQAVRALGFGDVRECRPGFADVIASIESTR